MKMATLPTSIPSAPPPFPKQFLCIYRILPNEISTESSYLIDVFAYGILLDSVMAEICLNVITTHKTKFLKSSSSYTELG
jgi:hypothetical protein